MEYKTLINRTTKNLEGVWDGRTYIIKPGKNSYPATMAYKFKYQNPRMGTQDPYSMDMEYLCGVEEDNDPITPTEQTNAIEQLNRGALKNAVPVVIVAADGLYARREVAAPLPAEVGANVGFSRE